jgi:CHASE2 domain-containing sensor protein
MSESSDGLIVLIGVAAVSAVLVHWRIRRYVVASIVSALVAAVVFQGLVSLQLGHIDPFAPIAFVLSLLVTTPLAFLVGWLFLLRRRAGAVSDT